MTALSGPQRASESGRPRSARRCLATRLTAGWSTAGTAAALDEHLDLYGPLPPRGGGRGRGALIEAVASAGLTGRGGAGFLTGTKMRAVASHGRQAVVVANGVESEPASAKDQALLSRAPHLVIDGATLAAEAVGADVVHLCLPRRSSWLTERTLDAVAERQRARLDRVPVEVHELPRRYVSSEETALVRWLNGGEAKPVATPPRPFEKGVGRRPTLVDNVETLAHVALIARYGPAWFRKAGPPQAPGTMLATVTGAVQRPGVYEIELGTLIGDVLGVSGLRQADGTVLIGGYFGTWHQLRSVAGLPMAAADLQQVGGSVGAGVLFALPPGACGLTETARVLAYLARQSAGQCGPCLHGLPAIADDFALLASGAAADQVLDRLERRLRAITGRGACRHPDGAVRLATSALAVFATDARAHASRRLCLSASRGQPHSTALPIPAPAEDGGWR
jgi:NADH:ubiquinone oxidoreductase subunit F (NADH-binding)